MAFKITKTYTENFPALRFIGIKYTNEDRVNGSYGAKWDEWHKNGLFDKLQQGTQGAKQNDDSYVGFMRMTMNEGENVTPHFEYWIGIFFEADTPAPEGFSYIDLPASDVGVAWINGSAENGEIYGMEPSVAACESIFKLTGKGERFIDGLCVEFERYNCPRFTAKDENGLVTLDYCIYLD